MKSAITGTLVLAAQYILIIGYSRHAMYTEIPQKVLISSGVVFKLDSDSCTIHWLVKKNRFYVSVLLEVLLWASITTGH